jgi:DNA-binding transcriptional ArsR family regulator
MQRIHEVVDDDAVWRALAHATRRRILDVLFDKPTSTGGVVDALGLERHTVMAHLAILREADLVLTEPIGRRRINRLNIVPIQQIHSRWVDPIDAPWAAALIAVRDHAQDAHLPSSERTPDAPSTRTSQKGEDVG